MKKNVIRSFAVVLVALLSISLFTPAAYAVSAARVVQVEEDFTPVSFSVNTDGRIENIYINENREVFVNGRNITTVVTRQIETAPLKPTPGLYYSSDEEWILAGSEEWHYDLGGLSVIAVQKILKSLGKTVALDALTNILGAYGALAATAVIDGVYIKDIRHTYYRNIDRPNRPEMKQTHDLSLVVFGATVYEF